MDNQLFQEFMSEDLIPLRAKFDDYLPVVLGIRPVTQLVFPAELPDAAVLVQQLTIGFVKNGGKASSGRVSF